MNHPAWMRLHSFGITHWTPDGEYTMCGLTVTRREISGKTDAVCEECRAWGETYDDLLTEYAGDTTQALAHLRRIAF